MAAAVEKYSLMCKNHEVAAFEYRRRTRSARLLEARDGARWAPPGCCDTTGAIDESNLNAWISMRYIPARREGLSEILRAAGCADAPGLMFSSLGLNLSDQYWFRPEGADIDWHEVNYFENPYVDGRANPGSRRLGGFATFGPGASTNGQVRKWWERRGGTSVLVKGSTSYAHEPFAEKLATSLYGRLLDDGEYVPYTLELIDGEPFSVCPCFITAETELASLDDVMRRYDPDFDAGLYEAYIHVLESCGVPRARQSVDDMVVCDYLAGNSDRHEYNLGVVLDCETKEMLRVAPIYDNGRAFYFGARREEELVEGLFSYTSGPFDPVPERQLALVRDLGRYDLSALDGFAGEVREAFASDALAPSWFPDAAARQLERRLSRVRELAGS